jgi:hypothetical protein
MGTVPFFSPAALDKWGQSPLTHSLRLIERQLHLHEGTVPIYRHGSAPRHFEDAFGHDVEHYLAGAAFD